MGRDFPLAGLLRLRRLQQDSAAGTLAAANADLRRAAEARIEAYGSLAATPLEAADAATLNAIAAARASSRSMLADLLASEQLKDAAVNTAQAEFQAARARSVGLEKLEAKHSDAVAVEDLRTEQNVLDELAGTAWHRRQKEASS
ncbi:flagellar FliJ family protein [Arthrobacter koreensis]|jgi:flagellar FliJ protein|uniref:Flagellar FliJ protein n=1 Tax=Arthrobacter koreensis TaxID=199136 RepID=A0ABY6FTM0_9MICC|nr:flagellar FliJ family protein [Arthrobacter koreensis]UYB36565.1 flagellar FliJ family protein [Arthrobacter koreensis]